MRSWTVRKGIPCASFVPCHHGSCTPSSCSSSRNPVRAGGNPASSLRCPPPPAPPIVRHQILATATMVAFLMYLDRICLAQILTSDSFQQNIALDQGWQIDWVKGRLLLGLRARPGARGLAERPLWGAGADHDLHCDVVVSSRRRRASRLGFTALLFAHVCCCGLAEAGYYPASSGLLTRWAHIELAALPAA
jgi:hypothetical protein